MYESFLGLTDRPFIAAPRVERSFRAGAFETAREALVQAVEDGGCPAVVIGSVGVGKSLLCQVLAQHFQARLRVALVASGRLEKCKALYQAIFFALRLPYRNRDESELRLSLLERLNSRQDFPGGLLMIVDDAQLASPAVLDELRMLSDQAHDGRALVKVILCGGPALEETLAEPRLEALAQRISARAYLTPLNRQHTAAYIRFLLEAAGGRIETIFSDDALTAVFRHTDGVPRLINQLGDHALLLARAAGRKPITAAIVDEAWADLQQLPAPSMSRKSGDTTNVIEFGALDDGPDEVTAIPFPSLPSAAPVRSRSQHDDYIVDELPFAGDDARQPLLPPAPAPVAASAPLSEIVAASDPFGETFAEEEPVDDAAAAQSPVTPRYTLPRLTPSTTRTASAPTQVQPPWPSGQLSAEDHAPDAALEPVEPAAAASFDLSAVFQATTLDTWSGPSSAVDRVLPETSRVLPEGVSQGLGATWDVDIVEPEDEIIQPQPHPQTPQQPPPAPSIASGVDPASTDPANPQSVKRLGRLFSTMRRGAP